MSRVDELPPDQRAALSLLLHQGKTYGEVAGLLGIAERAVHDRAQAALAVLAPRQARALRPAEREEIGDYLLGQQDPGGRLRTRTLLASSPAAAEWARAVAAQLSGLADGALPEIPAPVQAGPAPEPYPVSQATSSPPPAPPERASSRRGGALLLAAIAIVAVVVVLLVSGGGSSKQKAASTATTSAKAITGPKEEGRVQLHPTSAGSRSTGTVTVLSEGGKRAFYIVAEHIPASRGFFYAIWLYNSPTSALPLSKSPPVGSDHKLAGAALLPSNAADYREILLTQETSDRPAHPGHIVLRGELNLKE